MNGEYGQKRFTQGDEALQKGILEEHERDLRKILEENSGVGVESVISGRQEMGWQETPLENRIGALITEYTRKKETLKRQVNSGSVFQRVLSSFDSRESSDTEVKRGLKNELDQVDKVIECLYEALSTEQDIDLFMKKKKRNEKVDEKKLREFRSKQKEHLRQLQDNYGITLE